MSSADVADDFVALAAYAEGNLDRLCGRYDSAGEAFRAAAERGLEPQPGLALLRLARGSSQAAAAMVRRALCEIREPGRRVELLVAATEVFLAADDLAATETAAELRAIASRQVGPVLRALAGQTQAAVDVQFRPVRAGAGALRSALRVWRRVRAPHREARARVLLAQLQPLAGAPATRGRTSGSLALPEYVRSAAGVGHAAGVRLRARAWS